MAVLAECEICGAQYRVRDDRQGNTFSCRECGVEVTIPVGVFINADEFYEVEGRLCRRERTAVDNPLLWVAGTALATLLLLGIVGAFLQLRGLNRATSSTTDGRTNTAGVARLQRQTDASSNNASSNNVETARSESEDSATAETADTTPDDAGRKEPAPDNASRLEIESGTEEIVVERFSPEAAPPNGRLTIHGRGFAAVRRVSLAGAGWRTQHVCAVVSRSDRELVVRLSPAFRPGSRLTIVFRTEHGDVVGVPETAVVVDGPVEQAVGGQFFLVKRGGVLTGDIGSSWIFVESGGTLRAAGDEKTVFLQPDVVHEPSGVHNLYLVRASSQARRTLGFPRNQYRPVLNPTAIPVPKLLEVSPR